MNSKQTEMLARHPELKPVTFLSMIEEGLLSENSNQNAPEYQREVSRNRDLALRLLRARQNILPMLVMKDEIKNASLLQQAANGVMSRGMAWTFNLNHLGSAKMEEDAIYLKKALEVQTFLRRPEVNSPQAMNSHVLAFLSGLKFRDRFPAERQRGHSANESS